MTLYSVSLLRCWQPVSRLAPDTAAEPAHRRSACSSSEAPPAPPAAAGEVLAAGFDAPAAGDSGCDAATAGAGARCPDLDEDGGFAIDLSAGGGAVAVE
jgi:hypothetical protein